MKIVELVFYPLFILPFVTSAKILAILPFPIRSHNTIFQKYIEGLATHGHELIVASPFPPKQHLLQNHTFINTGVPDFSESVIISSENVTGDLYHHFAFMYKWEASHCRRILNIPELQNLWNTTSDEKPFDLVILESYYVHCYLPIAVIKKVPIIWYLAPSRIFPADFAIGNEQNPSYFPTLISRMYEFPSSTTAPFFSRLKNLKNYLSNYFYHYFYFAPLTEIICEEYFGGRVQCDLNKLFKSVSLMLTYSHPALHPRPTVPNHVGIGGLHMEPVKPLPNDLKKILDESTKDVVYVSFGSLVQMSATEDKLLRALLEAFSVCNCQILWKCDIETNVASPYRIPKNVFVSKWFPQRDVLAHKKVKAFISHGGLYSTFEALYTATPIIGVPLFFDQFDNVRRMEELGVGIHLAYDRVPSDLKMAVKEILNNPKFAKKISTLSKVLQDEQESPLDRAIYWTEYVLRHNGAGHLRSSGVDLPFFQYLLLDVLGVFIFLIIVVLYVSIKIYRLGKSIVKSIVLRRNKTKAS